MIIDLTSKVTNFTPTIHFNGWSTYILKITMETNGKGYRCKGLGYYN